MRICDALEVTPDAVLAWDRDGADQPIWQRIITEKFLGLHSAQRRFILEMVEGSEPGKSEINQ